MLTITFVNSTIHKSTLPKLLLDNDAIEIYRATAQTEVQRQYFKDFTRLFSCRIIRSIECKKTVADVLNSMHTYYAMNHRRGFMNGSEVTNWRVRLEAALLRMITLWHQSTSRAIRMHKIRLLSYRSRGTLMSYGDHSAQRCFKSNAPIDRSHDSDSMAYKARQNSVMK